jgi:hypothetical protein
MWRVSDEEEAAWRASLESPHNGERRGFASLAELFAFLEKKVGQGQAAQGADERGGDIRK